MVTETLIGRYWTEANKRLMREKEAWKAVHTGKMAHGQGDEFLFRNHQSREEPAFLRRQIWHGESTMSTNGSISSWTMPDTYGGRRSVSFRRFQHG